MQQLSAALEGGDITTSFLRLGRRHEGVKYCSITADDLEIAVAVVVAIANIAPRYQPSFVERQ